MRPALSVAGSGGAWPALGVAGPGGTWAARLSVSAARTLRACPRPRRRLLGFQVVIAPPPPSYLVAEGDACGAAGRGARSSVARWCHPLLLTVLWGCAATSDFVADLAPPEAVPPCTAGGTAGRLTGWVAQTPEMG
ncbi:hypothetical protein U9M48_004642 [Paspalum notatum var. saurae]|uniref:Uncharacterized protein n=1 Tax=Paspalum notatum var. saurae TaxID=547442 RepID=A0AAQ3PN29_PASNO